MHLSVIAKARWLGLLLLFIAVSAWCLLSPKLIFHKKTLILTSGEDRGGYVHFEGWIDIVNFGLQNVVYDSIESSCGCLKFNQGQATIGALNKGGLSYVVDVPVNLATPRFVDVVLSSKQDPRQSKNIVVEICLNRSEFITANSIRFVGESYPEERSIYVYFFRGGDTEAGDMNVVVSIPNELYSNVISDEWERLPRWQGSELYCFRKKISFISKCSKRDTVDVGALVSLVEKGVMIKKFDVNIQEIGSSVTSRLKNNESPERRQ